MMYTKYIPWVLVAVLGGLLLVLLLRPREPHTDVGSIPRVDTMYLYKDGNGNQVAQVGSVHLDGKQIDELKKEIGVELKGSGKVQTIIQYVNHTDTFIREVPVLVDGDSFRLDHRDQYISLAAYGSTKTKMGGFHLEGIDTLSTFIRRRNHLFKPAETIVDISNRSPYNKIVEGRSVTVKERRTIIAVGPVASWDFLTMKPSLGLGVMFPVIAIKGKK